MSVRRRRRPDRGVEDTTSVARRPMKSLLVLVVLAAASLAGCGANGTVCESDHCVCALAGPCSHDCSPGGLACEVQCQPGEPCEVGCAAGEHCHVECSGASTCD